MLIQDKTRSNVISMKLYISAGDPGLLFQLAFVITKILDIIREFIPG